MTLDYVANLPESVVVAVASVAGLSSTRLRHEFTRASIVQAAHIRFVLRTARELPWSLAVGNIIANLEALMHQDRPLEQTSSRIYDMLQFGIDINEVAEGVSLLKDVPWSSEAVEQGHAAASRLLRKHKTLGMKSCQARATVVHLASLFSQPDEVAKISRLEQRIARLQQIQPQRITGRHVFFGDLQRLAKSQRDSGMGLALDVGKKITKRHSERWDRMPYDRKRPFESRAADLRDERRADIASLVAALEGEVHVLRHRKADSARTAPPCRISFCRMSDSDKAMFDSIYRDQKWSEAHIASLREKAIVKIGPPLLAEQELLKTMSIAAPPNRGKQPSWSAWLAHNRCDLRDSIFKYEGVAGTKLYKFVYAMQHPIFFAMQLLTDQVDEVLGYGPVQGEGGDDVFEWAHRLVGIGWQLVFSDSGDLNDSSSKVFVLMDGWHQRGNRVVSSSNWVPIEFLLMHMPWPEHGSKEPAESSPHAHTPIDNLPPWVSEELLWDASDWSSLVHRSKSAGTSEGGTTSEGACEDTGFDEADDVIDELLAKREQVGEISKKVSHFRLFVRGGAFTMATFGVPFDLYRAEAIAGAATRFCVLYNIAKSASFSLSLHGEADSLVLADGWRFRLQQLFDLWVEHNCLLALRFGDDLLARVQESAEFASLASRAKGATLNRLDVIRSIIPRC